MTDLRVNYGKPVGVSPDWTNVSTANATKLTNDMFKAAGVPQSIITQYITLFVIFVTGG